MLPGRPSRCKNEASSRTASIFPRAAWIGIWRKLKNGSKIAEAHILKVAPESHRLPTLVADGLFCPVASIAAIADLRSASLGFRKRPHIRATIHIPTGAGCALPALRNRKAITDRPEFPLSTEWNQNCRRQIYLDPAIATCNRNSKPTDHPTHDSTRMVLHRDGDRAPLA